MRLFAAASQLTNLLAPLSPLFPPLPPPKTAPFGAVLSVKVLTDESGKCRGVGFVNFSENDAAVRAQRALHGAKVCGLLL